MKNKIRIVRPVNLGIIAATMLVICLKYRNELAAEYYTDLCLLILPAMLTAAAGYVVNDIYDINTDKINRPAKIVVGPFMTISQAWVLYACLSLISLAVSYIFSTQYLLVNAIISLVLFLYSWQLKGLPLIGNLVVALCSSAVIATTTLATRAGETIIDIQTQAGIFNYSGYIVFAFFISLIREIVKDMQDMEGDKSSKLKTYPIIMGIKGTKIIIYFFCGIEILFCGFYSVLAFVAADMYVSSAVMGFISLALFYFINRLSRAKTSEEFGKCSTFLKLIMFAGVINLIFS